MCSETSEAVGTTWEHAQLEFQKFLKIRITLICNISILIFSLDFDKQCQMCKKSSSRSLTVEFLGDMKKSDFFRVQDGEEMTIKFCP